MSEGNEMRKYVKHNTALKLWHAVADLSEDPKHTHETVAKRINALGFMGREVTPMEIVDLWKAEGGRDRLVLNKKKALQKAIEAASRRR